MRRSFSAALGNRIARSVRTFFQQDGSHENDGYADASYRSVNAPLVLAQEGTSWMTRHDGNLGI